MEMQREKDSNPQKKKQPEVRVFKVKAIPGDTKADRLARINDFAKDLRPLGKVKAILKSPNREKEILITLQPLEKPSDKKNEG
jgi:hypothetical protein